VPALICSVCAADPTVLEKNAAIAVFTDLEDGTSISPCPMHLDELAEYVVSMMQAFDAAYAEVFGPDPAPADASAGSETPPDPVEPPDEPVTAPKAPSGRSRPAHAPAPTGTADESPENDDPSTVATPQATQ
jgi:hypothetical protein